MNILPKKKWHVRTKENMARVRRDEAKAAEEEQRRLDRAILAENERRMQALRSKADHQMETMFGRSDVLSSSSGKDVSIHDATGHVNFFQDLEREERKNLGSGNKEYEAEKKKEQHEWESKMGIQKAFAEDTNEFNKKKEWFESMPLRTSKEVRPMQYVLPQLVKKAEDERKEEERRHNKKKKERKRRHSSDSSDEDRKRHHKRKKHKKRSKRDESEERRQVEAEKKQKLAALRDERMKRERAEHLRQDQLLHPERYKPPPEPKQKYNSQFNPHLARR